MTTKTPFNAEIFGNAVAGLLMRVTNLSISHSNSGSADRGQVSYYSNERGGILSIRTPSLPTFEEMLRDNLVNLDKMTPEQQKSVRETFDKRKDGERKTYEMLETTIRKWLDTYDIIFSGTEVRFGEHRGHQGESLLITVSYPVPKTDRREYA